MDHQSFRQAIVCRTRESKMRCQILQANETHVKQPRKAFEQNNLSLLLVVLLKSRDEHVFSCDSNI